MTIDGKVALVTGGSGGLGGVHCLTLAKAGCHVAVAGYTHMDKAEAVAEQIQNLGRNATAIKMDVSELDDVQRGVKQIEEALGPVEILVNNAASGIVRAATIVNTEKKDWDRDLSVNLTGAFNTIKCCMPGMVERGWGRIINISSITGTQGGMGQCSYAATKAGLIGLMKTAALEGARKGVTCNALVLGGHVVMNTGCPTTAQALRDRGLVPVETPTDEFIKAGGSVKCLVLMLDAFGGEGEAGGASPS